MHAQSLQLPTLCNPIDCSPPGSSVHGLPRPVYYSELPFPSPGVLPNPGMKPMSLALQADSLMLNYQGSPNHTVLSNWKFVKRGEFHVKCSYHNCAWSNIGQQGQPRLSNKQMWAHRSILVGITFWEWTESGWGLPWCSRGWDSVLPRQGAQVWSLIRELDPICCNKAPVSQNWRTCTLQ